jgi:N-methylhydantoinase A/oxoprolinase/acetone carboxylase beta subunit
VEATAPVPPPPALELEPATTNATPIGVQPAVHDHTRVDAPVYQRAELRPGHIIEGPAIVIEYTATIWVRPGWVLETLPDGALRARRPESDRSTGTGR